MGKHVVSAQQGCIRGPIGPKVRPSPRRVSSFHISQKRPLLSLSPPGSAKPFPSWLQGRTLKHSCHCREITTDSRPLKPLPALPHPAPLGPIVTPRSPPPPVAITQRASAVTCLCVCVCVCVAQLCTTLCHPMDCIDCSLSGSSVEFSRQEFWSRLPYPSPGDLPNPGTEPGSPAWQADSLRSEPPYLKLK